ncbi:Sugar/maltose fermentation stimulation protein [Desulfovibrio sp. DV]|uniref:DNA/RNA nuclease SfsA n=1 Tax=Desulfovibrio sp. DV TaxID=1844708 RepID=UPI00094BBE59|nr:DNA/RNA nuclease SfsA [Desulfovibrio sp. DV]OLN26607.1 Sugar/maltose fermentation stimulation protein [Desulfovibrio sp. DV]
MTENMAGRVFLPHGGPLRLARFVRRYKRFFIDAEDDGGIFTAHANNTGSMLGLLRPGAVIALSVSDNPKRRLPCTLEMVRLPDFRGDFWVGVNTLTPNRLFRLGAAAGAFAALAGYDAIRSEPPFGGGRLDFLLTGPGGRCFVECKNVTMVEDGAAMFPDAATERGCKHLVELTRLAREGVDKAALFFCVQRPDGGCFAPAAVVDPDYAALLAAAVAAGVLVLPYRAEATEAGIILGERLPLAAFCNE